MSLNPTTIFGIIASALTTFSLLPQLIKIIKEKEAKDISLVMLFVLMAGVSCWIYYGILKEDVIIIVANSVSFLLNGALVAMTIIHKGRGDK